MGLSMRALVGLSALGMNFGVSSLVLAQSGSDAVALEEIIVTAQRREESIQSTPISITAVSGEEINQTGRAQMDDVLKNVPALIVQGAARGFQVTIRGIGTNLPPGVGESSVSTNFDGVYSARAEAGLTGFYDLARVEVLRGPQGTLYGRNATAGVINVISNDPSAEFGGSGTIEFGNYSLVRAEGVINVPLDDKFAVRAAFTTINRDGYLSNGHQDAVATSGRMKGLYQPSDDLKILLGAEYIKIGGQGPGGTPLKGVVGTSAAASALTLPSDPYFTTDAAFGYQLYKKWKFWSQVDWNIGLGVLTFIPAYQDGDGIFVGPFAGNVSNGYDPKLIREKSGELRLASQAESNLKWVVGAYHYDMKQVSPAPISGVCETSTRNSDGPGAVIIAPPGFNTPANGATCVATFTAFTPTVVGGTGGVSTVETINDAAFGQVTIPIGATLRVNAGLRATRDTKKLANLTLANSPFSRTWKSVDWRAGVEYDLAAASMLYANAARGHRPGGFNQSAAVFQNQRAYEQEEVTAYEIGSKNRFFSNRLQVNGDVFYYDYKGFQLNDNFANTCTPVPPAITCTPVPANVSSYFNVPTAKSLGVELETEALLTAKDRISASAAYLDTELTSDAFLHPYGTTAAAQVVNLKGNPFPRAPKWTASATYDHTFELTQGITLMPRVNARYLSGHYIQSQEQVVLAQYQRAYWNYDADVTIRSTDGRWGTTVWVKNISEEMVQQSWFVQWTQIAPPRTYGISITAKM